MIGARRHRRLGRLRPAEPRNRRTRASIVVESGQGTRLLVDTSPDMRTQLLDCRVPSIDAILYHMRMPTHHGLDDVRILNRMSIARSTRSHGEHARRDDPALRLRIPAWEPPASSASLVPREGADDTITRPAWRSSCSSRTTGSFPRRLRIGGFGYSTDVVPGRRSVRGAGWRGHLGGRLLPRQGPHKTHADLATVLAWSKRIRPRRQY